MIEKKIVDLSFDGENFNGGVATSLKNLDKLEKSLQLKDANKGFENITTAINGVPLDRISQGVELLASRFSVLGIVAMTVISNITNSIINLGKRMADAVIFKPMRGGFAEYETQMNAIQTTLANTASKGTTLRDVNEALAELNDYADLTIYNFTEMTKNIGTFTAAGIDLKTSTAAIKGIANLAAISGSNAQQASTAMYQLSQALASGTVKLMDWNSVVNAGMGGQVFQDALKETARVHGIKIDEMITKEGSFRETLQNGWLTASILTETLQKFTGDLSEEQLKSIGYTDDQIQAIIKLGKTANDAATKVKTFTQLKDTLAEALGSGWTKTWQLLLGDFEEAKKFFTYLSDTFGTIIAESSDARNHLLQDWSDAGGRTFLIEGLQTLIESLLKLKGFIGAGIGEIFKPLKYIKLLEFSLQVRKLANELEKGIIKNGPKIQLVFRGLASAVDILIMFVKSLTDFIGKMWKKFEPPKNSNLLDFFVLIADAIYNFRNSLKDVDFFGKMFDNLAISIEFVIGKVIELAKVISIFLAPVIEKLLPLFNNLKNALLTMGQNVSFSDFFKNISSLFAKMVPIFEKVKDGLSAIFSFFSEKFNNLSTIFSNISKSGSYLASVFSDLIKRYTDFQKKSVDVGNVSEKIKDAFLNLKDTLSNFVKNIDFNQISQLISSGLFSGILVSIIRFINSSKKQVEKFGGIADSIKGILAGVKGFIGNFSSVLTETTNTLKVMQQSIKADIILKIAISIGILAVSLIALSMIDKDSLYAATTAISALFLALMSSISSMNQLKPSSMLKLSVGLIAIAGAILIISAAVSRLSGIDPDTLNTSVLAIGSLLAELSVFLGLTAKLGGKGIKNAGSLILISAAILVLVEAVKKLGELDPSQIKRGLLSLGGILAEIAAFSLAQSMSKNLIVSAVSVGIMAGSLLLFSIALRRLSDFSYEDLQVGLLTMAAAFGAISLALNFTPSDSIKTAAGFMIMSVSLLVLSEALKSLAQLSYDDISTSLTALAGSLLILSLALFSMKGSLSGAVVLMAAAVALTILAPVLMLLSQLSLEGLAIALGALAGTFIIFGLAGWLLAPLVPVLIGLSASLLLMGVAILAIGASIALFATGMAILAASGAAGAAVIVLVAQQFATAVVVFAQTLNDGAPIIAESMTAILSALITSIKDKFPEMVSTILEMISVILDTISQNLPSLIQKGFDIILSVVQGVRNNIGELVKAAIDMVVAFIDAIASKIPDIIQSAVDLVIAFIDGLASAIEANTSRMVAAMQRLGWAMIDGLVGAISSSASLVKDKIVAIAMDALDAVKRFLGIRSPSKEFYKVGENIILGWSNALTKYGPAVSKSLGKVASEALSTVESVSVKISDAVNNALDTEPIIRPVLDLDQFSEDSEKMDKLLAKRGLSLATSTDLAKKANTNSSNDNSVLKDDRTPDYEPVSFVQNNYSPKALSRLEIYRQTRNLLKPRKAA